MAWTYDNSPGTDTAAERRDSVRLLIGDTDTNDQQVTDEEIAFFLSQVSNRIYNAAALSCRAISAKYSRLVDTTFDEVSTDYSDRSKHYRELALVLEEQAKKYDGKSLRAFAGGISEAVIEAKDRLEDRPLPAFRRNQFRNLPSEEDSYGSSS